MKRAALLPPPLWGRAGVGAKLAATVPILTPAR
jgi:hypothetical protein